MMILARLFSGKENLKERLRSRGDVPGYLVVIAVMAIIAIVALPLMRDTVAPWIEKQFTGNSNSITSFGIQ